MMKKLLGLGEDGVHASSPIKTAFENIFTIYDGIQSLLETSAYVVQDVDGRNVREMFPSLSSHVTSDAFDRVRDDFKAAKRTYVALQNAELERNPSFKAIYFSKTFNKKSDKEVFAYAEKHYWPNLST